jgi:hypothetical protein
MKTASEMKWLMLPLLFVLSPALAETPAVSIPLAQVGAVAGQQYHGDGLSVTATADGAQLRCVFQRLAGEATREGLWLVSTAGGTNTDRFRVVACALGREHAGRFSISTLSREGKVTVNSPLVRFIRPALTEEYTVSLDGVRQDFVVTERPPGVGTLHVELAVNGAEARATTYGAELKLPSSRRALAYSRLRVVDALGKELRASLKVLAADQLAVAVEDTDATYPVRIDPTFSDADWIRMNPGLSGVNGFVNALAVDANGNVYAGGDFTVAGSVIANHIAKWDGTDWRALGAGVNGSVYALALNGADVYAGGSFTSAGGIQTSNIARWDGTNWSALGVGVYGGIGVRSLAVDGLNLYVGGGFLTAGVVRASCITKWNGSSWTALGSGRDDTVHALAMNGTTLYAGGQFTGGIAKWNGTSWSSLGSGLGAAFNPMVRALAVSGGNLYVGGYFKTAGGVPANNIAKWDGSTWSGLGDGLGPYVYALAATEDGVYAGDGSTVKRWAGGSWSAVGIYLERSVLALAVQGTNVIAGGEFKFTANQVPADHVAKWDGTAWSLLAGPPETRTLNDKVHALAVAGGELYVGGDFTQVGAVPANGIAKWNGESWSALGDGLVGGRRYTYNGTSETVLAIAVSGSNLYAGGYFTNAGGLPANHIARWDGVSWSPLGSGLIGYNALGVTFNSLYTPVDATVCALAVSGSNLYVGGNFTNAGGVAATCIAKWNGVAWSSLGSDTPLTSCGAVRALVVSGGNLYVGGHFSGGGLNAIARWNGSGWYSVGDGVSAYGGSCVSTIVVTGSDVYVGGRFTSAGYPSIPAQGVAKWNGSSWSAMGLGLRYADPEEIAVVWALALDGTNLYAGGFFNLAGEAPANNIAKWDGTTWSALGSGTTCHITKKAVNALVLDGAGHLYVGGGFAAAGAVVSPYLAQANIAPRGGRLASPMFSPITGFNFGFQDGSIGQPYRIQSSTSLTNGGWTDLTNFTYNGPLSVTDTSTITLPRKFYRAVTP